MSYVIDILLLAILVATVVITAKKGFLSSIISVAAIVLSIIISLMIAPPVSGFVYDSFIKDGLYDTTYTTVENVLLNTEGAAAEKLNTVYDSLPSSIKSISGYAGFTKESLTESIAENGLEPANITNMLFEKVIDPAVKTLLNYLFILIFFVIILFVTKGLSKLITNLIKGNVLGGINTFLGGVLGLLSGSAYAVIAYMIITLAANLFTIEPLTKAISESYICNFISGIL